MKIGVNLGLGKKARRAKDIAKMTRDYRKARKWQDAPCAVLEYLDSNPDHDLDQIFKHMAENMTPQEALWALDGYGEEATEEQTECLLKILETNPALCAHALRVLDIGLSDDQKARLGKTVSKHYQGAE